MDAIKERILAKKERFQQAIAEINSQPSSVDNQSNIMNFGKFENYGPWGNFDNGDKWGKKGG